MYCLLFHVLGLPLLILSPSELSLHCLALASWGLVGVSLHGQWVKLMKEKRVQNSGQRQVQRSHASDTCQLGWLPSGFQHGLEARTTDKYIWLP